MRLFAFDLILVLCIFGILRPAYSGNDTNSVSVLPLGSVLGTNDVTAQQGTNARKGVCTLPGFPVPCMIATSIANQTSPQVIAVEPQTIAGAISNGSATAAICSPSTLTQAPIPISIQIMTPATPNNNLGERGAMHQPSAWSIFVDGSAAVFGVLSAAFAVMLAILAIKGFSSYKGFKAQLMMDVRKDVINDLDKRLIAPALERLGVEVDTAMKERVSAALLTAELSFKEELQKLSQGPTLRDEFAEQIVRLVEERMKPKGDVVKPDEFEVTD